MIMNTTYSPEDDKLRMYYSDRLDDDTYARVKELGFGRAPLQECFFATYTPAREDLCIELAGSIEPEETTLVERAEAKTERLDTLATKRAQEADAFHSAAIRISERFAGGQPILVGHHSERRARRDHEKMDRAMAKAAAASKAVSYWNYRAEGVEQHANMKSNPRVRENRIKKLLADLRDRQRDINHANLCLTLWEKIAAKANTEDFDNIVRHWVAAVIKTGSVAPRLKHDGEYQDLYWLLDKDQITSAEVVERCLSHHEFQAQNPNTLRWIAHILTRLAYERSELGSVSRFTGTITPVVLQGFARTMGTDTPKAKKSDTGFRLSAIVPLPAHMADGKELDLSTDAWVDLMESCGYEVPAEKPKKPPILNFRVESIVSTQYGNAIAYLQIEMTKAEYAKIWKDYRGVRLADGGAFRFKTVMTRLPGDQHPSLYSVFLTDSKVHDKPESNAVTMQDSSA